MVFEGIDLYSVAGMAVVGLVMAWGMLKVSTKLIKEKNKTLQAEQMLQALGFKNFRVKDLNEMTQEGFGRLVVIIRILKPPTGTSGILGELQGMAQMEAQMRQITQGIMPPVGPAPEESGIIS